MMEKGKKYVSNVKLSGYKSIDNVSVDFQSDFNVIIGKNASGKTNFLTFLNNIFRYNFSQLGNFSASFEQISGSNKYLFSYKKETVVKSTNGDSDRLSDIFNKNIDNISSNFVGKLSIWNNENKSFKEIDTIDREKTNSPFYNILKENNINLIYSLLIKHGLPQEYPVVSKPLNSYIFEEEKISEELFSLYSNTQTLFLDRILFSILITTAERQYFNNRLKNKNSINNFILNRKTKYKEDLLKNLNFLTELANLLKKYSPITDLRINDSYSIDIDFESKRVSLRNLYFEFLIDGIWYPFNSLSDGTKRLFYIISEIFALENLSDEILNIALIEEPELGVHPHQLHQLMKFLKERSHKIQIIITTHSPQALDVLNTDELDAITIAYREKGKTEFKKLTREKKEKAIIYMKEIDSLSVFWLNSDLED